MRDDLLDAQATVDWAISQIPLLQNGFVEWNKNPYRVVVESDPNGRGHDVVAYLQVPFPRVLNAWTGAIVNSLRSSLDLLAATLAVRNGIKPSNKTHFPIYTRRDDFLDPLKGIESKKWLSETERAAIKTLEPYKGGDNTLWPLHQLDIARKHERLISVDPGVSGFLWTSNFGKGGRMIIGGTQGIKRLKDKTILNHFEFETDSFDMTQGHTVIAAHITFNEAALGITDQEVAETLVGYSGRIAEIINIFK